MRGRRAIFRQLNCGIISPLHSGNSAPTRFGADNFYPDSCWNTRQFFSWFYKKPPSLPFKNSKFFSSDASSNPSNSLRIVRFREQNSQSERYLLRTVSNTRRLLHLHLRFLKYGTTNLHRFPFPPHAIYQEIHLNRRAGHKFLLACKMNFLYAL